MGTRSRRVVVEVPYDDVFYQGTAWLNSMTEQDTNEITVYGYYPTYIGGNPVVFDDLDEALKYFKEDLQESCVPEEYTFLTKTMTRSQFDDLSDHDGW